MLGDDAQMQRDRQLSQHPVDIAIREILRGDRPAADLSASAVADRMASVTFSLSRRGLPRPLLAFMELHGYAIERRPTELTNHWAKHVLGDGQWSVGTDATQYMNDLRAVCHHSVSRLVLRRIASGSRRAIAIANTLDIVPSERLGANYGPELVVVYSADTGKILSGYMVQIFAAPASEPETIWLRT